MSAVPCGYLSSQLVHFSKTFTVEDGLASRSILKIIRDDQGKTWLFTRSAIQVYDGATFRTIRHSIPSNFEDDIKIGKIGPTEILIMKPNEAWKIDTKTEIAEPYALASNTKYFIADDRLVTWDRLSNNLGIDGDSLLQFTTEHPIIDLVVDGDNKVGILTEDSKVNYQYQSELHKEIDQADKIVGFIHDNLVYIKQGKLFIYDPVSRVSHQQPRDSDVLYALIRKDKAGNSLLSTSYDPRRFFDLILYTGNGEECDYSEVSKIKNTIRDFHSDNFEKEILVATYNGLIYQSFSPHIQRYNYTSYLGPSEFGNIIFWMVERTATGDIYFAKEAGGIFKIVGDTTQRVQPFSKLEEDTYTSNFFGIYHSGSDQLLSYSLHRGYTILHVWDFENDPTDIKLPGRYFSLTNKDERFITLSGSVDGVAHQSVFDTRTNTILTDKSLSGVGKTIYHTMYHDDTEYLATNTGLYTVNQDADVIDTLSEKSTLYIASKDDYIIAGKDGDGLEIYKSKKLIKSYTTEDGLVDNIVHSITTDSQDNIWVSTMNGVAVLDAQMNMIKNIRYEDGLSSSELNSKSILHSGSHVYIGSINGVNKIDEKILSDQSYYPIILSQLQITDSEGLESFKTIIGQDTVHLDYGVDSCNLVFSNYQLFRSYFDKDHIFQNQFSVYDDTISLKNLTLPIKLDKKNVLPVYHRFRAGSDGDSELNAVLTVFRESFFIRYFAISLATFLILLLLYALYNLNRKRTNERQEAQLSSLKSNLDAMRGSALRAQMNPHFIFNALGSIQYYIQKKETEKAEEYLADFSTLMRSTLESSKADYTKVSQELEMLSLYIKLEHLRFEDTFDYEVNVEDNVDMSLEIPSMVIQPFIENAVNHGVFHLTQRKGFININMYEDSNQQLICEIIDNGVGREMSRLYRKKKHKSRALANIDERIKIMNSLNHNNLSIEIRDRFSNGVTEGTIVKINFGVL